MPIMYDWYNVGPWPTILSNVLLSKALSTFCKTPKLITPILSSACTVLPTVLINGLRRGDVAFLSKVFGVLLSSWKGQESWKGLYLSFLPFFATIFISIGGWRYLRLFHSHCRTWLMLFAALIYWENTRRMPKNPRSGLRPSWGGSVIGVQNLKKSLDG